MTNCECECRWGNGRLVALCRAHESAFIQFMVQRELNVDQIDRQVQAVRERLRTGIAVQCGDFLYNARGQKTAVVKDVGPHDVDYVFNDDSGGEHRFVAGSRLVITAEGIYLDPAL